MIWKCDEIIWGEKGTHRRETGKEAGREGGGKIQEGNGEINRI